MTQEPADVARSVRRFLVDVSAAARPVRHDGPCGDRLEAPCGNADAAPFLPAERLRNGTTLCHRCSLSFRPGEPVLCGRGPLT